MASHKGLERQATVSQKGLSRSVMRTITAGTLAALRGIRKAKEHATGVTFTRLHRVESMLVTVQGRKAPRRDKPKGGKQQKGKAGKSK